MDNYGKPTILVVDDVKSNVDFILAILKPLDVRIIEAYSGEEALQVIQGVELTLALIDIQMPGMDGLELATTILKKNNRELFPIIFITARPYEEEQLIKFYQSGIIDFINKPFRKFILLSKIKILLELNRQKQKIAVSEKMYRTLLDASPEGIIIMDPSGQIQDVSKVSLMVFGVKNKQDLINRDFFSFISPEDHPRIKDVINRSPQMVPAQNVEIRVKKTDKSQFIGEISTTVIYDNDGIPSAVMAIIRDISERKQAEQQQIQTERMASLGEMATGIAHEINQPLNNISFGLDNLLAEISKHPEIDQSYFETKSRRIFDNIDRISYIIDHIRTFSQGQDDIMRISFSINDSILNGVSMISEQIKQKGIDLILSLDDGIDSVVGNTYQFEQVILNLLLNAKDAIDEKRTGLSDDFEKVIRVTSYQQNSTIYVEVSDNGIGMTPGSMNQVMFPFYTTKESGKGTGLGLSISLGIIKELNGTIEVESQYWKGTTLRIVIPVEKKTMLP